MATEEITRTPSRAGPPTRTRDARTPDARTDGAGRRFAPPARRRVSRAYSRFVSLMKVSLPAVALLLVALLAAWPTIQQVNHPQREADVGRLEMQSARYFSIDADKQPFSVTADYAEQSADEPGVIILTNPEAEMTETDGSWVVLKGKRGRFNQETNLLVLKDDVVIMQDDGYEFTSDEALVDVKQGLAWGQHDVVGQGPFGEIKAQGFQIIDKGAKVVFTGAPALSLSSAGGIGANNSSAGGTGDINSSSAGAAGAKSSGVAGK